MRVAVGLGFGLGVAAGLLVGLTAVGVGVTAVAVGATVGVGVDADVGVGLAVTAAIGDPELVGLPPLEMPGNKPIMRAIAARPATATRTRPAIIKYGVPARD